ncbi:MAG: O-antigen ligase family protein [Firmicutes bacterium]|nr:O-antigen ligase family protein [Bacillota bacterium]
MSSLLLPRQQQLNRLFHLMVVFAVLGPTLGIKIPWGAAEPWINVTLFRIAFFLLVASLIIRWVQEQSLESTHLYPIRWHTGFFAFWVLYSAASLAWAANLGYGIRYTVFLVTMLLLCLSFPFFLKNAGKIICSVRVLFGVYFTMVVFGLIESLTFWHLPASRYFGTDSPNPTSFFTNQNDFATAITLGLPFLVTAMYMLPIRRRTKGLLYVTGIIALCVLFITGSRSNSGFALPLAGIAWLVLIKFTLNGRQLRRHLLKGIGLLVLAALLVNLLNHTLLSQHTRDRLGATMGVIQDLRGDWSIQKDGTQPQEEPASGDQSINMRKALIMNGLQFLHQSNYFGVGAGNIEHHMVGAPGTGGKVNIHNWWVEILVNYGVAIFLLYMALYGWLLYRLWRLARIENADTLSPTVRWGAAASLIALVGYFFGGMSPSTAIHFTPMWIVYGLALAVVAVGTREEKGESGRKAAERKE